MCNTVVGANGLLAAVVRNSRWRYFALTVNRGEKEGSSALSRLCPSICHKCSTHQPLDNWISNFKVMHITLMSWKHFHNTPWKTVPKKRQKGGIALSFQSWKRSSADIMYGNQNINTQTTNSRLKINKSVRSKSCLSLPNLGKWRWLALQLSTYCTAQICKSE